MNDFQFRQFIKNGFNEASVGYDNPAMRFFDKTAEHLVSSLLLKGNEHVLDIATGTGKLARELLKRLPQGHVDALDLSEGMLSHAQETLKKFSNVNFHCVDVNDAQFSKNSFDGLCSSFGVFFWPNMQATLEQLLSFLKPGGFFAMTSFFDGSFMPLSEKCLKRFEAYDLKLPKSYTWQKLDSLEKHHDLLKSVGLKNITSHRKAMGYDLKDPEEWWDIVRYTGFRSFLNQLSEVQVKQYKEEHLQEIMAHMTDQGIYLNVDVIFTIANK